MRCDPDRIAESPGDEDEQPTEEPLPQNGSDVKDDEVAPEELNFCELCGASEDDDDELLRCEECGRLHCSNCREYDEDGTPYCADCFDEIAEE